MFIRRPPQWLRTQKRKAAVLLRRKEETKTNWQNENSPRLCLLALESFRTSLWPMEPRKTIASATSPSCIVSVAFQAMQDSPPCNEMDQVGGPPSYGGTGGCLSYWDRWSLLSPVVPLPLLCPSVPPPQSLCVSHSSGWRIWKSV